MKRFVIIRYFVVAMLLFAMTSISSCSLLLERGTKEKKKDKTERYDSKKEYRKSEKKRK